MRTIRTIRTMGAIRTVKIMIVVLITVITAGGGCSKKKAPSYGTKPKAPAPVKVETPPVEEEKEDKGVEDFRERGIEYRYSALGKRDPFKPYIIVVPKTEEQPAIVVDCATRYDRDQYRLVGIILGEESWTIFEDPTGLGCFIKEGGLIGRGGERVRQILNDRVIISGRGVGEAGERKFNIWLYKPKEVLEGMEEKIYRE